MYPVRWPIASSASWIVSRPSPGLWVLGNCEAPRICGVFASGTTGSSAPSTTLNRSWTFVWFATGRTRTDSLMPNQ